ncbi:MAG: DUF6599 family protein [Acidobacteriaceae bacterium]
MRIGIKTAASLLLLIGLMGIGCRKKTANPFPPSGAVAGWQKTGNTQTYAAANLWQYLDGGADQYVNAGVTTCATSDYKFQGNLEAVVDVYRFKTADSAKQLFHADPATNSQPGQLGDEARVYGQSVVFRQGKVLVRIVAYESGPGTAEALLALGKGVQGRL